MAKVTQLFAANLKKARNKLGYSQAKLAELCDLSNGMIAEYELAKSFPSARALDKIAGVLGLKPFQLLLDEENQDKMDKFELLTDVHNELKDVIEKDLAKVIKKYLK